MHRLVPAVLAISAALMSSGCGLFGVGCFSDDAGYASLSGACFLFSGDCCPTKDDKGFITCGSLLGAFVFPCGQGAHDIGCFCFASSADTVGTFASGAITRAVTYAPPPVTYGVDLPFTGMHTSHHLKFDAVLESLQTFSGTVAYSPGFTFNGFTALGPPGTTIGSYGFDFDSNDVVDVALPLRALGPDTAYVDIDLDGQATAVDPTVQHLANVPVPGAHTFTLALPAGGDMAPNLSRTFREFRVHVFLAAGVLDNPSDPGAYSVTGNFTSVDPDSGDADNGTGFSPMHATVPAVGIMIDESPLDQLDHYLCYKTKPSKGNTCTAAASANAGGLCTSDADCGGTAGACAKNKFPKGVQATLADRYTALAERTADVAKPIRLCTPADANGTGRHDVVTHLRGYQIKDAKGSPPRVASPPLRVVNELGTVAVQIKAPDTLYEPAAKALGAVAPPLAPNFVDRYQCYKAKLLAKRCSGDPSRACKTDLACGTDGPCLGKFPKGLQVTLADQFTAGKRFDVVKPTRLCTPALSNGDPLRTPDGQLLCYKVKPAAGEPKHVPVVGTIHTTSRFGRDRLDTVVEDELCVPSLELSTP